MVLLSGPARGVEVVGQPCLLASAPPNRPIHRGSLRRSLSCPCGMLCLTRASLPAPAARRLLSSPPSTLFWVGPNRVGSSVPDEGGAAVVADRGLEGGSGAGHFCPPVDAVVFPPASQVHHPLAQRGQLHHDLPRYGFGCRLLFSARHLSQA